VAVQKMDGLQAYHPNEHLKKIAIGTWLTALFPNAAYFYVRDVIGNRRFFNNAVAWWLTIKAVCLYFVTFFYRKVSLGVRNRKLNKTSEIDHNPRSKVAKITGL